MEIKETDDEIDRILKSDHFGIEIQYSKQVSYQCLPLKSDHFGIEIDQGDTGTDGIETLKSDHFGIEIFHRQK